MDMKGGAILLTISSVANVMLALTYEVIYQRLCNMDRATVQK